MIVNPGGRGAKRNFSQGVKRKNGVNYRELTVTLFKNLVGKIIEAKVAENYFFCSFS